MAYDNIGHAYEVEIAGFGVHLMPGTYQKFAITPFAPRIATQDPSHSTLDAYQAWTQKDWSHGFGFIESKDIQGYNYASGNVDTRTPHALQLMTAAANSEVVGKQVRCYQDFPPTSGKLYAGLNSKTTNTTLRVFDGTSTWAEAAAGAGADGSATGRPNVAVTDLLAAQDASGNAKLFIALGQTQDFQTFDGATTYATPVAGEKANLFAIAGGYMWYADDKNNVKYSSDPTTAWSAAIKVGNGAHPITAICEFNNKLYVGKTNGIYYIEPGYDYAYPAVTFTEEINAFNALDMTVWQGNLYFRVINKLYRINAAHALSEVTPPRYNLVYPYTMIYDVRALTAGRAFLYYAAKDSDASAYHLFAFDGVGHHRLIDVTTSGIVLNRALYFSQSAADGNPRLWYCTNEGGNTQYYVTLNVNSELPYASFPTTGTHYLESSVIDFDMPEITKNYRDMVVEVVPGDAATDGSWGTYATDTAVGTAALTNIGLALWTVAPSFAPSVFTSYYSVMTNWGFSIPTGKAISGIGLSFTVREDTNSFPSPLINSLKIVKGGVITGTDMAGSATVSVVNSTNAYVTVGGAANLWGTTLTAADVNAANFGIALSLNVNLYENGELYARTFALTVYYNTGGSATMQFALDNSTTWQALGTASQTERYTTLTFARADGKVQSATANSLTDATVLTQADGYWTDATIRIVAGTGFGQKRRVTNNVQSVGYVTVTPAWGTVPDTTSQYQVTWESRNIRFRTTLATTNTATTPVVRSLTLRFEPRPDMKYGWRFTARSSDFLETNRGNFSEAISAQTLLDLMFNWRNTHSPLLYKDKDGVTYKAVVTDCTATESAYNPLDEGQQQQQEYTISLTLAQAIDQAAP